LRSLRRRTLALAAPAAMTVATLLSAASPAAAGTGWQLTDEFTGHPVCYNTGGGAKYLEVDLNGSWSTSISIGASGLPSGTTEAGTTVFSFTGGDVSATAGPVPAGSSNGTGPITVSAQTFVEGYVLLSVPYDLTVGTTFDITLWASDGTTKQTEIVPIVIKSACVHY
jgi:hypothetical protein